MKIAFHLTDLKKGIFYQLEASMNHRAMRFDFSSGLILYISIIDELISINIAFSSNPEEIFFIAFIPLTYSRFKKGPERRALPN